MVDVFAPLRSEPILDDFEKFTIRWSEYFEQVAENITIASSSLEEEVSAALTEIKQASAIASEQAKSIDEIDQLSLQVSSAIAQISELKKEVFEINATLDMIISKADIAVLIKRIKELEALAEL